MLESPLTIARIMQERLLQRNSEEISEIDSAQPNQSIGKTWIFTSATLGNDEQLSWFTEPCGLRGALHEALAAYFDVLAQYSLQDLLPPSPQAYQLLSRIDVTTS